MIISVVYCPGPDAQTVLELEVPEKTTVQEALQLSGIFDRHPEISPPRVVVGIDGERVDPSTLLSDGERVEIYRPLKADPKVARRQRAARRSTRK